MSFVISESFKTSLSFVTSVVLKTILASVFVSTSWVFPMIIPFVMSVSFLTSAGPSAPGHLLHKVRGLHQEYMIQP